MFHTVEMDEISGITFFFSPGQVSGIHIHRSDESCAIDTFVFSCAHVGYCVILSSQASSDLGAGSLCGDLIGCSLWATSRDYGVGFLPKRPQCRRTAGPNPLHLVLQQASCKNRKSKSALIKA